ncbi:MFS transporter [Streptomyces sp. NPDC003247]|uniref:MFS transporter n=1 Tax=Streptomyces sp. NPDC003247 TaxID=3364677 RepID=UPI0036A89DFB
MRRPGEHPKTPEPGDIEAGDRDTTAGARPRAGETPADAPPGGPRDSVPAGTPGAVRGPEATPPPGRTRTFAALRARPFRRFFTGQAISLPGTWMQSIGQGWLIVELTHSGTALGLLTALQFLPGLLLAPWAGLLADRFPKRNLMLITQSAMAGSALTLGLLTVTHHVGIPAILVCASVLGVSQAVDNPVRQAYLVELTGPKLIRNAVSLNGVLINAARAVGPAVAGVLIVAVGTGWCFLLNALSFTGIILALRTLPRGTVRSDKSPPLRELREGFGYVRSHRELLRPLLVVFLVGTFAAEFPITLPLLARTTFGGDGGTYGWMTSAMGVGAVTSGFFIARRDSTGHVPIAWASALYGGAITTLALSPVLPVALVALFFVGVGSSAFMAISNATLQTTSESRYRGRVMALWSVGFAGSTPIGGPVVGAVGEHLSPRWALGVGALACAASAVLLFSLSPRRRDAGEPAAPAAAGDVRPTESGGVPGTRGH